MTSGQPQRVRDVVYVVGAGFSAGLGYPLTKDLLGQVWQRLDQSAQQRLEKVIRFHHPAFDPANAASFPNILGGHFKTDNLPTVKTDNFWARPRLRSSTSFRPRCASRSAPWCASFAART